MTITINKKKIDSFIFSGGECHLQMPRDHIIDHTHILAELNNSDAIMQLLLGINAIRRINPLTHINTNHSLFSLRTAR